MLRQDASRLARVSQIPVLATWLRQASTRRVTLLNDPKALQQPWTDDAVRLVPDSPADVGKQGIYATDVRTWADAPEFAVVSYKPDIRDVRVVNNWAFECGLFDVGLRPSSSIVQGKALRILHRESSGDWKFSRIMIALNSGQSTDEAPPRR